MRAVIRRKEYLTPAGEEALTYGPLVVDIARRQVTKGEKHIDLTMKEFDLLVMLMRNRGRVMTRDALLDKVWGIDFEGGERAVDVGIKRLRAALGEAGGQIRTVLKAGYKLEEGSV